MLGANEQRARQSLFSCSGPARIMDPFRSGPVAAMERAGKEIPCRLRDLSLLHPNPFAFWALSVGA